MIQLLLVEDHPRLRRALKDGLEATAEVHVLFDCESGEQALEFCLNLHSNGTPLEGLPPQAVLMDVQLAGEMNGIQAAAALRRRSFRASQLFSIPSRMTTLTTVISGARGF